MTTLFFTCLAGVNLFLIYSIVRNNNLKDSESIFWMLFSLGMVLMPLFIPYLSAAAKLVGVHYPPALLFTVAIMFCIYMLFRVTVALSRLDEKIKNLTQSSAIVEKELRDNVKAGDLSDVQTTKIKVSPPRSAA